MVANRGNSHVIARLQPFLFFMAYLCMLLSFALMFETVLNTLDIDELIAVVQPSPFEFNSQALTTVSLGVQVVDRVHLSTRINARVYSSQRSISESGK